MGKDPEKEIPFSLCFHVTSLEQMIACFSSFKVQRKAREINTAHLLYSGWEMKVFHQRAEDLGKQILEVFIHFCLDKEEQRCKISQKVIFI